MDIVHRVKKLSFKKKSFILQKAIIKRCKILAFGTLLNNAK